MLILGFSQLARAELADVLTTYHSQSAGRCNIMKREETLTHRAGVGFEK